MIARFLLMWVLFAGSAYAMLYVAKKGERKVVWKLSRRTVIAVVIGLLVIIPLFLINQVQGL